MPKIGKLLIVEDDQGLSELLYEYLDEYFEVKIAHDGEAGYNLACEFKPDCIISDVMMPKLSGINMLKQIRRTQGIDTVAVILLSVLSEDKNRIRAYDHLADLYFTKPFNMDELISATIGLVTMRKKLSVTSSDPQEVDNIILGLGITDYDQAFLHRVSDCIEEHMCEFDLNVDTIARSIHVSKRQLERRLKDLENMTPAEFIRRRRMEKAKQLADSGRVSSLPELSRMVGLKDTRTFIKRFKDHFNYLPNLTPPK